jgi:Htaa
VSATLEWGLKQSFRAYVEGAGGSIETGEGVGRAPDGAFVFSAAPGDVGLRLGADGKPQGVGSFLGEVRCQAHGGMLKVTLADPSVEIGPDGGAITVVDPFARETRVELAVLELDGATAGDNGDIVIPTKLSKDGWRVLGDHYPPMTPLDPVRLRLAR